MAKKFRKIPTRKPDQAPVPDEEALSADLDVDDDEEEEAAAPASAGKGAAKAATGASPAGKTAGGGSDAGAAGAQERELELLLSAMGAVMGGLSGFSQVPMTATEGNVMGAVAGALLGLLLGFDLGRTLFLKARQQWAVWLVLGCLTYGGLRVQGLWGAVGASLVVTVYLLATWRGAGDSAMPAVKAGGSGSPS